MITKIDKKAERARRHARVRTKVSGTTECPRLAVSKSNKNIIAQIIDDTKGETLVYVSTLDSDIKTKKANIEAAKEVGAAIAKKAKAKKIKIAKIISLFSGIGAIVMTAILLLNFLFFFFFFILFCWFNQM